MNCFGTDGIRGTFGSTLKESTAFLLGKSLALLADCPIIVVARDTRLSGEKLFCALSQGIYAGGGNVINLGVLPTNSVGHFTRKMGGDYGVMITASHNPPQDNGLKVFDRYGVKLCLEKQLAVSRMMNSLKDDYNAEEVVCEPVFYDIENIYADDVLNAVKCDIKGLNVALDCCFGASYKAAPKVFEKAGAKTETFCNANFGDRINVGCGATNTEFLLSKIQNGKFDLAFSFDGDADRLAVFEGKQAVPNNKIFYAIAKFLKETGSLKNNAVCGTVLTNGGVEKALKNLGVTLLRSDVGDSNVFNAMVKNNLNFGGEESGHYLLCDFATSSDAIINALFCCEIFKKKGSILEYAKECEDAPFATADILLNAENERLSKKESLAAAARRITDLYPDCRIVLRKSGTENKVRAYLEGESAEEAKKYVVATFSQKLSSPKSSE